MPLDPKALEDMIVAQLAAIPIGVYPASAAVASTPGPDGSVTTVVTPAPAPTFVEPGIAKAIAGAVAKSVVAHILSNALVGPLAPTGTTKIT
jgi:hypothetical protein